jgi:hypothetical protein
LLATAHEQWDITAYRQPTTQRVGLFRQAKTTRMEIPNWHGHCNGWAAAAIRHAEPQQSVQRNGVVFSPADIKGLLAELYLYNDIEDLSGSSWNIQAGLLHAVVANWIGRGSHALGMEADPGPEKWNYPAYAFESTPSPFRPIGGRTDDLDLRQGQPRGIQSESRGSSGRRTSSTVWI